MDLLQSPIVQIPLSIKTLFSARFPTTVEMHFLAFFSQNARNFPKMAINTTNCLFLSFLQKYIINKKTFN